MNAEQRKYIRFSVHDNTFAALGSGFETVGKVSDISIKGLTLSYVCERIKATPDTCFSQVDILLSGSSFHLHKVHCKIVYDIQDPKSNNNDSIVNRRCGLQFGKLSKSQSDLLDLLLENYTTASLSK